MYETTTATTTTAIKQIHLKIRADRPLTYLYVSIWSLPICSSLLFFSLKILLLHKQQLPECSLHFSVDFRIIYFKLHGKKKNTTTARYYLLDSKQSFKQKHTVKWTRESKLEVFFVFRVFKIYTIIIFLFLKIEISVLKVQNPLQDLSLLPNTTTWLEPPSSRELISKNGNCHFAKGLNEIRATVFEVWPWMV